MRHLLVSTLLLCLPAFASAADADTPATRRVQAERYLAVSNVEKMMADMSVAMTQNLPKEKADEVKDLLTRHVRIDALKEAMLISMIKHFTTRELSAMADFYGSPEGKSALEKFGPYMGDIMPMLQAEMQHAVQAAEAEKAGNSRKSGT
jgi:hypothetical protein